MHPLPPSEVEDRRTLKQVNTGAAAESDSHLSPANPNPFPFCAAVVATDRAGVAVQTWSPGRVGRFMPFFHDW